MTVGRMYAPEWRDYLDPLTGRRVRQLTDSPAEDYHLYFYNPSVTPDGNYLIFISERTGLTNRTRVGLEWNQIDIEPSHPATDCPKSVLQCTQPVRSAIDH